MAIRPVDLQLAYLAAPQNAALLNAAQESPAAAQQAQAAAFAAEMVAREEHVDGAQKAKGGKIEARERDRSQQYPRRRTYLPNPDAQADAQEPPYELGDGEHFIDVTA